MRHIEVRNVFLDNQAVPREFVAYFAAFGSIRLAVLQEAYTNIYSLYPPSATIDKATDVVTR